MLLSNNGPLLMEVNSSPGIEGIENSTEINVASRVIDYLSQQLKSCWAQQLLTNQQQPQPSNVAPTAPVVTPVLATKPTRVRKSKAIPVVVVPAPTLPAPAAPSVQVPDSATSGAPTKEASASLDAPTSNVLPTAEQEVRA
jgi:hypothetical protein